MGKPRVMKYLSIFAVLLVALLLPTGLLLGTVTPGTADAQLVQEETALLQFSSGGHVLGFGERAVYLAGLDHALKVEFVDAKDDAAFPVAENAGLTESGLSEMGKVTYKNLWDNIDVIFSAATGGIAESTYIIHPGGDPQKISLSYNVPVEITPSGGISLSFPSGYMTETPPVAWQEIDGRRVPVEVHFLQQAEDQVGFSMGSYNTAYAVYIDPVYQWHTFYGSPNWDEGRGIAVDSAGNIYVTGESNSAWNGPGGVTPQNAYAGNFDIVIVKLDSAGTYQWHTFYGSTGDDIGYSIAVDTGGSVYVTGYSDNTWNGPGGVVLPKNPHSGSNDMVIIKLDSAGNYHWHTFYGSSGNDCGYGIALDLGGSVYVTGYSDTNWTGPGGVLPHNAYTGGSDIVVVKLDSAGFYQWHTFYGSTSIEYAYGIAVAADSSIYVAGESSASWTGPGGVLPHNAYTGGSDIVVVKLDGAGFYQWHTFYGSVINDLGSGIAVDTGGSVYVTGYSNTTWNGLGGIAPLNAYAGGSDIVIVKLDSGGAYQWHTFYGSPQWDEGHSIALDAGSSIYVTGYSDVSWSGLGGAAPLNPHTGFWDIFIVKLNNGGVYQWHTFYGSPGGDEGYGIAVDASGSVNVTGYSQSAWIKLGGAAPLNAHAGGYDFVIIKSRTSIPPTQVTLITPAHNASVVGTRVVFKWNAADGATRYQLQVRKASDNTVFKNLTLGNVTQRAILDFPAYGAEYKWRVRAGNAFDWGQWSAYRKFKNPFGAFNHNFNTTNKYQGWIRRPQAVWNLNSTAMLTAGQSNRYVSARRGNVYYQNLDYRVRLRRTNSNLGEQYLVIRAGAKYAASGLWHPGYGFGYRNNGTYRIIRLNANGTITQLKGWTNSNRINKGGFNTLRVRAVNNNLRYFINGTLVWSANNSAFARGTVGVMMFRTGSDPASTRLLVDWAKMSNPVASAALAEEEPELLQEDFSRDISKEEAEAVDEEMEGESLEE